MDDFLIELGSIAKVATSQGETAWNIEDTSNIIKIASEHNRIILGGDILNICGEYTYDNWYYNLDHSVSVEVNVERSGAKCLQYINNYMQKYGNQFLVVFVFE